LIAALAVRLVENLGAKRAAQAARAASRDEQLEIAIVSFKPARCAA
jgi:hypothetical protein